VWGKSLMDFCDFVTAQVMLPSGALLTSILVGWFASKKIVREEFTNWETSNSKSYFNFYLICVRYIVPVCILLIFMHQLGII
jgi:NSS family neurotransmitter:Na+ symporter